MMTTPYAALISDPTLFLSGEREDVRARNRRFIYVVIFWLGAFAGAALSRWSSISVATAVVAGLKVLVAGMMALQEGKEEEHKEAREEHEDEQQEWQEQDARRRSQGDTEDGLGTSRSASLKPPFFAGNDQDLGSSFSITPLTGTRIRDSPRTSRGSSPQGDRRQRSLQSRRVSRRSSRDETRVPM